MTSTRWQMVKVNWQQRACLVSNDTVVVSLTLAMQMLLGTEYLENMMPYTGVGLWTNLLFNANCSFPLSLYQVMFIIEIKVLVVLIIESRTQSSTLWWRWFKGSVVKRCNSKVLWPSNTCTNKCGFFEIGSSAGKCIWSECTQQWSGWSTH